MTRFEREQWNIASEPPLKVFDTALGKLAINICLRRRIPAAGARSLRSRCRNHPGAELH